MVLDLLHKAKLADRTVKSPQLVRLKKLFNAIPDHVKSQPRTQELGHILCSNEDVGMSYIWKRYSNFKARASVFKAEG